MFDHILAHGLTEGDQIQLCPFAPRELHRRYEIAIAGNQNDDTDMPLQGQRRNIEPYAHIDAFLLDVRLQMLVGQGYRILFAREEPCGHLPTAMDHFAQMPRKRTRNEPVAPKASDSFLPDPWH